MAQKRMFDKKITNSDKFLDLPLSAQALYFHLNMSADDDGFIDNAKTIKRMVGASDYDLKILVEQSFLILFNTGVVVIKDWRIHNTIRKDRYRQTLYIEELKQLKIAENNEYQEFSRLLEMSGNQMDPTWQPSGNQMEPQYSIDKYSIDKYSIDQYTDDSHADNPLKEISDYYQQEIGVLSPNQLETLKSYLDDGLEKEVVKKAISKTADAGNRSFNYLKAILRNYSQNGLKTLVQVEEADKNFQNRKRNTIKTSTTNVPEWTKEEVEITPTEEGQKKMAELRKKLLEKERGNKHD